MEVPMADEPQRWSKRRKMEVVLRLLRGEALDDVSRELKVEISRLEKWRDKGLHGLEVGLREREGDPVQEALHFFPAPFTSTCEAQMCAVRDGIAAYTGLTVWGVTTHHPILIGKWEEQHGFEVPILADVTGEVSRTYVGLYGQEIWPGLRDTARRGVIGITPQVDSLEHLGRGHQQAHSRSRLHRLLRRRGHDAGLRPHRVPLLPEQGLDGRSPVAAGRTQTEGHSRRHHPGPL
jgi:peroxiredoxin